MCEFDSVGRAARVRVTNLSRVLCNARGVWWKASSGKEHPQRDLGKKRKRNAVHLMKIRGQGKERPLGSWTLSLCRKDTATCARLWKTLWLLLRWWLFLLLWA